MFREEYIKANEQIKPDDDFLKRLKETIAKEAVTEQGSAESDTIIHIGDYVDLKNVPDITNIETAMTSLNGVTCRRKSIAWKKTAVVAACFVFIATLSFVASKMDILNEHGLGLKEIQETIAKIDPMPGAKEFLDELRSIFPETYLAHDMDVVEISYIRKS